MFAKQVQNTPRIKAQEHIVELDSALDTCLVKFGNDIHIPTIKRFEGLNKALNVVKLMEQVKSMTTIHMSTA